MIFFDFVKFFLFLALIPLPIGFVVHKFLVRDECPSLSNSLVLGLLTSTLIYYLLLHSFGHDSAPIILVLMSVFIWSGLILTKSWSNISLHLPSAPALIFIIFSVYINSLLLVPFGQLDSNGVALSGAHFLDSTWHLALINSLNQSFPPQNPLYAGTLLSNYHYLVDLLLSLTVRLTQISVPVLFFRIFGPFMLLLFSYQAFSWLKKITKSDFAGIFGLVLLTLSSNFYYLASLVFPQPSLTPSIAWIEFYSTKTVNYPLIFSLSVIIVFLSVVINWKKPTFTQVIVFGLLSGGLFGFKAHTTLVWLFTLGLLSLHSLLRRQFLFLLVPITASGVIWIFSQGLVSTGSRSLNFEPFWYIKVMYESSEHLNYPIWELKRQTLLAMHAYLGVLKLYVQGTLWFMVINFGVTLLGGLMLFQSQLNPKLKISLAGLIVGGLGLSLSFVLASTAIVSIQFAYLALFAFSILFAILITQVYQNHRLVGITLAVVAWACMLPGVKLVTSQYQSTAHTKNYGSDLVSVVTFLSGQPANSVILAEQELQDSSFLPGYSGQSMYLGDPQILRGLFIDITNRQLNAEKIFTCQTTELPIDYILVSGQSDISGCTDLVFTSGKYQVYSNPNRIDFSLE